jgi:hypothetical protein
MIYITANTGHSTEWPMNRLKPDVRKHLIDWLKLAVRTSAATTLPAMSLECRIKLTRHPNKPTADSVMLIIERERIACIIYVLCLHRIRAGLAWDTIVQQCGAIDHEMPQTTPWLLAVLLPPAAGLAPDTLAQCADFAACLSTILIEKEAKGELTP